MKTVFYCFVLFLSTCIKIYNAICTPLHRSKAFLYCVGKKRKIILRTKLPDTRCNNIRVKTGQTIGKYANSTSH